MTPQEIFNKVWHHMAKQRVRSMRGDACVYRSTAGLACAVGCLLTDKQAKTIDDLPFGSITGILSDYPQLIPKRLRPHQRLLQELQEAHDSSETYGHFCQKASRTAKEFDLKVPS
jgi:hypothetical protein